MKTGVQSYDPATRRFENPVDAKVRRLLTLGCIKRVTDGLYECLPIAGYNTKTYSIRECFGRLMCNCQKGRKGAECSHAKAVKIYREEVEGIKEEQLHLL